MIPHVAGWDVVHEGAKDERAHFLTQVRQLGISKRGDTYLRTAPCSIHGARLVVIKGARTARLDELLKRRPFNVVVAAVANKLARTIWAVLAKDMRYTAPATAL